ncbi:ABC-ATPase UvrA [Candidatus Uhrbacteria bacterium RIFCSPHIGHO2_12_FULL_60_25]|uniref:UvrABC system protein A n=1 Tax=Candidatus Uhrbacteria bacterium RIFCSPHIGHO2_12_FULL_60_25 TaxID=1802399 RepID=A0A1F7ULB1_9BACT|nr:MAG: ABC-ATPase UvrA [Candidatus Uhrbacteria bacterium RIFCSPHIGHO2_02_FULL_60_44]OGL79049.1 MAG: ABC-ATPase UvrA [Candidatus Uhrbacteria bacterium RIFCSPHIGHO2_12_FULL_60_25]
MQDKIVIKGAREHNLKNISLELPRNKMIVFTGLSGSGKSSLAFDTIFAEGQRRYVESLSAYARQFLGQMDKPDVDEIEGLSPAISIDQKAHSANPRSTVATITEIYDYMRVLYARVGKPHCPVCGKPIRRLTSEQIVDAILKRTVEIHTNPQEIKKRKGDFTNEIVVLAPAVRGRKGEYMQLLQDFYHDGFLEARVDGTVVSLRSRVPLRKFQQHTIELIVDRVPLGWPVEQNKQLRSRLAEAVEMALERGNDTVNAVLDDESEMLMSSRFSCPDDGFAFPEIEPRLFSFNSPYGACPTCNGLGTKELFSEEVCPACNGARLRTESMHVLVNGKNIVESVRENISASHAFYTGLDLNETDQAISAPILREILARLQFLLDVGLHYLTLDRIAGSLSGGEAQRIRLASQIGSRLVGTLYILDEPTIGLHQRDNVKLIETLEKLRDLGNTIIVVEHDEDTISASDYLVDIGPGAGRHGGEIVAAGPMPKVLQHKGSLTCAYLRGDASIPMPKKRRADASTFLEVRGALENNLKNINVKIPLKRFVCVTGVSGSGKSTLMIDIIYRALARELNGALVEPGRHKAIQGMNWLDKIVDVDQSPIGRTPRSNPATYTGIWNHVRDLFAMTPEARVRAYTKGRFSFNVQGGRCEHCEGNGQIAIEMHFLPTVFVQCDVCKGRRFGRETLEVKYRNKNIHEVLTMTVEEANGFFSDIPPIHDKTKILEEVGLGYIQLGQSATTLSGGEAQRIKLAAELARRDTGKTFYLFDEPTTGLHFEDIRKFLEVLHRLVNRGNSVVVIEHNLDVIKNADWIIDLGPEGGDDGGRVVAQGTPEDVAKNKNSYTGQYLRKALKMKSQ